MRTFSILFLMCVCLLFPSQTEAKGRGYNYSDTPVELRGSKAKQKQQNRAADRYNLSRIKDRNELEKFIAMKGGRQLVLLLETDSYYLDPDIGYLDPGYEELYQYTRIWTRLFLDTELAEAHLATGDRFKIASLVRPLDYQQKLYRNKNNKVGAIVGKKWWQQSSHPTGATVDISFDGMSLEGKNWLRKRFRKLQSQGKIIAAEEPRGRHFHLMILPSYK